MQRLTSLEEVKEQITPVDWDTIKSYYAVRASNPLWIGNLDLDKPYSEQKDYAQIKHVWDNVLPPLKLVKWGSFLDHRKNKKIQEFMGLKWNSNIYLKFITDAYTANPKDGLGAGHFGFSIKDENDEHIKFADIVNEPLSDQSELNLNSMFYHAAKAHWIMDTVQTEGMHHPVQAVLTPSDERKTHMNMFVHPGSVRSLVIEEMDDPEFDLLVWDAYDFVEGEVFTFDGILDYWKNRLESFGKEIFNMSFTYQGGIVEFANDFASANFREKVYDYSKNVHKMFKRKPLNIYIGIDSTHNKIENITKYSIEKSIEKSWSGGSDTTIARFEPEIKFLDIAKIPEYTRPYANQNTEFTYSRFMIPYLENYEGFSMFVDDDLFFTETPLRMFYYMRPEDAVACIQYRQYDHVKTKFNGAVNIDYPCKLWSSMMFFNNGHEDCKKLTPEVVNTWTGAQLHQFTWTDKISKIPEKYIFTEGYDDPVEKWHYSGIHFTRGGPWIDNMDVSIIDNLDVYEKIKNSYFNSKNVVV
jgi:hypothetical protein